MESAGPEGDFPLDSNRTGQICGYLNRPFFTYFFYEKWKAVEFFCSTYQIDVWHPLNDDVFFVLGHAAHNPDNKLGLADFSIPKSSQTGPDFVFRVLTNTAGVVKNEIGVIKVGRGEISIF